MLVERVVPHKLLPHPIWTFTHKQQPTPIRSRGEVYSGMHENSMETTSDKKNSE